MAREIRVLVRPGARRERILEGKPGTFEIAVKEEAERGEANARVREILALRLGVPLSKVRIAAGQRSRTKRVVIL